MMTVATYNPLDSSTLEDPYPLYDELRETRPVFWHDGMRSWVVTRYADCRDVLRDHTLFARDRRRAGVDVPEFRQSLQTLDPPDQKPLRSLMVNAFKAQDLVRISGRASAHLAELLQAVATAPTFDFMHAIAAPFALRLTADLLGVPVPDPPAYHRISEGIALRMDAGLLPGNVAVGDAARTELNALGESWFGGDGVGPGVLNDIAEQAGTVDVPLHYVHNSAAMMFNASYGTLYAMAGNVALLFAGDPDVLCRFREDGILATGVDELVRFDGPAQGTSRVAIRDTVIAGTHVRAGDVVLTLIAAANRDPREFDAPHELRLARTPNRHLGFGWGSHACLGSVFGHVSLRTLIGGLLATPATLTLAGRPVRRRTATVRSIDHLPVTFAA